MPFGVDLKLKFDVFICGAVVMSLEILGSRLLAPFFGNTIFVWGSLIGVVLASLSLGYFLGGRIADIRPSQFIFSMVIFSAGALIFILPFSSDLVFEFVLTRNLGTRYSPLLGTVLMLAAPSTLLGMISPFAIKLAALNLQKIGSTAGNLYSLSTIGSIIGTFVTVFILIPEFGVEKIIFTLSFILMGVSLVSLGTRMKILTVAAVIIGVVIFYGANFSGDVVIEKDTLYHHLVVAENDLHSPPIRVLVLDNNYHSAMFLDGSNRSVYKYTDFLHLGLVFKPDAKRVLFIGGGGFSAPKNFRENYPDLTIDVVEVDPEVVEVAKEYFRVKEDDKMRIHIEDGRIFLSRSEEKYDIIILDAYSKNYVPFHLMTVEFFQEVYGDLNPGGVVVSNMVSSFSGDTSILYRAEYRTIADVFPNLYVFPVSHTYPERLQNIILVGTKSDDFVSKEELLEEVGRGIRVRLPALQEMVYRYMEDEVPTSDVPLLTDDYAPVAHMLNPITGKPFTKEFTTE